MLFILLHINSKKLGICALCRILTPRRHLKIRHLISDSFSKLFTLTFLKSYSNTFERISLPYEQHFRYPERIDWTTILSFPPVYSKRHFHSTEESFWLKNHYDPNVRQNDTLLDDFLRSFLMRIAKLLMESSNSKNEAARSTITLRLNHRTSWLC